MNKLTLQEYLDKRIKDIEHYIQFNERKDDKDFFAHKELELYQMAQKYMQLSNQIGCPLDVVFKALKEGILVNDIMFTINGDKTDKTHFKDIIFKYHNFYNEYGFGYGTVGITDSYLWWISLKDYKKTWWLSSDLEE